MMKKFEQPLLTVILQRREDGGLRVFSNEVPGLILSGQYPQKVLDDIKPALETIMGRKLDVPKIPVPPIGQPDLSLFIYAAKGQE